MIYIINQFHKIIYLIIIISSSSINIYNINKCNCIYLFTSVAVHWGPCLWCC